MIFAHMEKIPALWIFGENEKMGSETILKIFIMGLSWPLARLRGKMETLEQKVARVLKEEVAVVPYDSRWLEMFEEERQHLRSCLPLELIGRVEHFGSTAVPGLPAKPIVDVLVEVTSLEETKKRIVPILEAQGYEYFWRPSWGDDTHPFYAWFIKRNCHGNRTFHIHMVENGFEHWDRLLFRNYLKEFPDVAREYAYLKEELSKAHHDDRVSYTDKKGAFITQITQRAREYYGKAHKTSADNAARAEPQT